MVAPGGLIPKECEVCGGKFTAKRDRARFCSPRCQMRSSRATKRGDEMPPPRREGPAVVALPKREPDENGLLAATRRELEEAGRLNTSKGQAALLVATVLDSGIQDTGSSIAALIREHRAAMALALDGAVAVETPLQRQRRSREMRAS